jgi:peptide deformylase
MKILTINDEKEAKFLRQQTADFDFSAQGGSASGGKKHNRKEINELIKQMRRIMTEAVGIGLSANQLGLDLRLFVAQISDEPLKRDKNNKIILPAPESMKFYAIFNPEIIKFSKKKIVMEEGCLSVPGIYGEVERPEKITLVGQDKNGKKLKIKTWGWLARVFQHEVDHLNGILFIDRTKNVYKVESSKYQVSSNKL